MYACDGDNRNDDEAEGPKAREQAQRESESAENFDPRGQKPANFCRDHIKWKRKIVLNVRKPIIAMQLAKSGFALFVRHQKSDGQQCYPVAGWIQ